MYPYPVPITNFNETYQAYKNYYIAKNGSNKFEKIFDEVTNSTQLKQLYQLSVSNRIAPTSADFLVAIVSIKYFIIAKNSTRVMGGLIGLFYWNETINRKMNLATEEEMTHKIKSVFDQLLW